MKKSSLARKHLGKVQIGKDVSNDDKLHGLCRSILTPTDRTTNDHQIIHTKVLTPGDFRNLFEQYQIADRMMSTMESLDSTPKHVFCGQLGANFCWRCSRELIDRNMQLEINKVLPNSDPEVLTRVICIENTLTNMNLPLFPISETRKWNNASPEKSLDDEPLFFPYPSSTPVSYDPEKSELMTPTSADRRHVTFDSTFVEDRRASTESRKSIQFIGPPVLMNTNE